MAVRLTALRACRPLSPRKNPGTHFRQRLSQLHVRRSAERIRSTEKSSDIIGVRIRDLPACTIMFQPTTLPRSPRQLCYITIILSLVLYGCETQSFILEEERRLCTRG
jgi:hypothetical protein